MAGRRNRWGPVALLLASCSAAEVADTARPDRFYVEYGFGDLGWRQFPDTVDFDSTVTTFGLSFDIGGPQSVRLVEDRVATRKAAAERSIEVNEEGEALFGGWGLTVKEWAVAEHVGMVESPDGEMWINPDAVQRQLVRYLGTLLSIAALVGGAIYWKRRRDAVE